MNSLDDMQKLLKEISDVVNSFKSEAVQLRVVDILLGQLGVPAASDAKGDQRPPRRAKRRKKSNNDEPLGDVAEKPASRKAARTTARSSASPGAFAMINQLLSDGFFKEPKARSSRIVEVQKAITTKPMNARRRSFDYFETTN